jgi:hypothetical protein
MSPDSRETVKLFGCYHTQALVLCKSFVLREEGRQKPFAYTTYPVGYRVRNSLGWNQRIGLHPRYLVCLLDSPCDGP